MKQPPENPAGGLQSFLEFTFDEYSKIQKLLTTFSVDNLDRPTMAGKPNSFPETPASLTPLEQRLDFSDRTSTVLYNKLVFVLQNLFPRDFSTTH
jgi:hypothetical protein